MVSSGQGAGKAPRASASLRPWGVALCAIAVAGGALFLLVGARPRPLLEQGQRMFHGEQALTGRMTGHEQDLPGEAVRCSNCHEREGAQTSPDSQSFGTVLGPGSLTRAVARRGGPAVRYTQDSFCRVLRDGIDPAHVIIPQALPRYALTGKECEALWRFLTAK